MSLIYAVAGESDRVVGVTLSADGTAADLTGETIECRVANVDTDDITTITGLSGNSSGQVSTPFAPADLVVGTWTLEWVVTNGPTYPSRKSARPTLIVRPQES